MCIHVFKRALPLGTSDVISCKTQGFTEVYSCIRQSERDTITPMKQFHIYGKISLCSFVWVFGVELCWFMITTFFRTLHQGGMVITFVRTHGPSRTQTKDLLITGTVALPLSYWPSCLSVFPGAWIDLQHSHQVLHWLENS